MIKNAQSDLLGFIRTWCAYLFSAFHSVREAIHIFLKNSWNLEVVV